MASDPAFAVPYARSASPICNDVHASEGNHSPVPAWLDNDHIPDGVAADVFAGEPWVVVHVCGEGVQSVGDTLRIQAGDVWACLGNVMLARRDQQFTLSRRPAFSQMTNFQGASNGRNIVLNDCRCSPDEWRTPMSQEVACMNSLADFLKFMLTVASKALTYFGVPSAAADIESASLLSWQTPCLNTNKWVTECGTKIWDVVFHGKNDAGVFLGRSEPQNCKASNPNREFPWEDQSEIEHLVDCRAQLVPAPSRAPICLHDHQAPSSPGITDLETSISRSITLECSSSSSVGTVEEPEDEPDDGLDMVDDELQLQPCSPAFFHSEASGALFQDQISSERVPESATSAVVHLALEDGVATSECEIIEEHGFSRVVQQGPDGTIACQQHGHLLRAPSLDYCQSRSKQMRSTSSSSSLLLAGEVESRRQRTDNLPCMRDVCVEDLRSSSKALLRDDGADLQAPADLPPLRARPPQQTRSRFAARHRATMAAATAMAWESDNHDSRQTELPSQNVAPRKSSSSASLSADLKRLRSFQTVGCPASADAFELDESESAGPAGPAGLPLGVGSSGRHSLPNLRPFAISASKLPQIPARGQWRIPAPSAKSRRIDSDEDF